MAAPRKTTQPVNTNSGDTTTPLTDEEKARVAAAEHQPEQTLLPELTDEEKAQAIEQFNLVEPSTTEEVTLSKEVGGHKSGATITVTHGAAEYLREQGYVDDGEGDED